MTNLVIALVLLGLSLLVLASLLDRVAPTRSTAAVVTTLAALIALAVSFVLFVAGPNLT